MLKRILSGVTALAMLMSLASLTAFADDSSETSDAEVVVGDLDDDILPDGDDDFSLSDNYLLQALLYEMELDEEGSSGNSGDEISPYWYGGGADSTHGLIAKACMSEFGSNYTAAQKKEVQDAMVYGAYKADTKDLHHRIYDPVPTTNKGSYYPTNKTVIKNGVRVYNDEVIQYHAAKNYLLHLKCLWKYAKLVNQVTYSNGKYSDAALVKSIQSSVLGSTATEDEKKAINTYLSSVQVIFYHYAAHNSLNRELTTREKKYLVVGLALHLIGDIYAHRSCVPITYATNSNMFNHYFVNTGYIKKDKLSDLKTEITGGNFYCTKFGDYIDKNNMGSYTSPGQIFEDNTDFMFERYYVSGISAHNFVSEILISGNTFNASKIVPNNYIFELVGLPLSGQADPLKLYKYTTYLNDL